jgi:hypothetical protein
MIVKKIITTLGIISILLLFILVYKFVPNKYVGEGCGYWHVLNHTGIEVLNEETAKEVFRSMPPFVESSDGIISKERIRVYQGKNVDAYLWLLYAVDAEGTVYRQAYCK